MPVEFIADLHIHTCLSPCADLAMSPKNIIEKASSLGINIIAVCDHNSAENAEVTRALGVKKGIQVIPGLEITSSEEVHILALFDDVADALSMQGLVYEHLQPGENDEDAFGMQVVANAENEVLGFNRRLLIGSTGLSVNQIVDLIHRHDGIAIASHIDRNVFGIIGQLGFIPADITFEALEISHAIELDDARQRFSIYNHIPWIRTSDAHCLEHIGNCTTSFTMYHGTFEELRLALQSIKGRHVVL